MARSKNRQKPGDQPQGPIGDQQGTGGDTQSDSGGNLPWETVAVEFEDNELSVHHDDQPDPSDIEMQDEPTSGELTAMNLWAAIRRADPNVTRSANARLTMVTAERVISELLAKIEVYQKGALTASDDVKEYVCRHVAINLDMASIGYMLRMMLHDRNIEDAKEIGEYLVRLNPTLDAFISITVMEKLSAENNLIEAGEVARGEL